MKSLYKLNTYILRYKKLLITGTIFILISNIFALYPAEFVRHALNYVENNFNNASSIKDTNMILLKYSSLIILFAILKGIFMYFMRQTIIVMSRKIEFDLKNDIYKKYQTLDLLFYKKNNIGDLMNRITEDVSRVRMYLGPAIMYAINMIFLFSLVISKMFYVSTTLTLYVLIPLPILAITVFYVSNKINKNSERVQRQLSSLTSISQENFSAINIIKTFRNENSSFKYFVKNCKEYTRNQLKLASVEAWFFPLIILLIGFSTIITIYIGGIESINKKISTGNIAEFIIYINMLTWPVASIGWVTSLIQRSAASMKRINEFLESESEIKNICNQKNIIKGDIVFKNVSFTYKDTGIKGLKNINLKIKENTTLGIFGKTGSGKSTIANLICRLYDPISGVIEIDNKNIKELNLYELRKTIGYVPQDGFLFSGTISENVIFGNDSNTNDNIIRAIKNAEILEEINNFKNKLNTIVGERGVQLSGGQRQRISIARAIYINPSIYIFDDCLSAVDANKERKILNNLKKITNRSTNIIISHRVASLKHANHIIVLDKGSIIEEGNHEELKKSNGFYSQMYKKQTIEELSNT